MSLRTENPDEVVELWWVMCPHCRVVERVAFNTNPCMKRTKWPILKCRCGKYFAFIESLRMVGTLTYRERNPDELWERKHLTVNAESES